MRVFFALSVAFLSLTSLQGQSLVINELLASNDSYDYDDFFQFEDWIEVYNGGGIQNLAGYYLSDDPDTLNKWMFPSSNPGLTTILPGGHLRIWCDDDEQQGEDHANFKISNEGESLFLVAEDGTTILDSITIGIQQTDISFGRSCDGCSEWQYFNVPTPDAPNLTIALPPATLYINEFQSVNTSTVFDESFGFSSWIEVFNPNDYQVNLANYTLSIGTQSHVFSADAPWQTTVEPNGFQLFWLDGNTASGANHTGIVPFEDGVLSLLHNDNTVIDEINWFMSLEEDSSRGRISDGSPNWTDFSTPTPRVTNSLQIISPASVVLNEVQSDNFITYADEVGEFDDWVELYNPTNEPIDLAGYYVSDRLDVPQKWQITTTAGDSTVIQPGAFLMLIADENGSQGWNHMNFKLSSLGESIALRSPDGFSVADSVFLPELAPDRSWGRQYDAGAPWVEFFIPTPDASNGPMVTENLSGLGEQNIYPNPISSGHSAFFPCAGTLYDTHGKVVLEWFTPQSIALHLPAGLYFARLESPQGQSTQKVLVH